MPHISSTTKMSRDHRRFYSALEVAPELPGWFRKVPMTTTSCSSWLTVRLIRYTCALSFRNVFPSRISIWNLTLKRWLRPRMFKYARGWPCKTFTRLSWCRQPWSNDTKLRCIPRSSSDCCVWCRPTSKLTITYNCSMNWLRVFHTVKSCFSSRMCSMPFVLISLEVDLWGLFWAN